MVPERIRRRRAAKRNAATTPRRAVKRNAAPVTKKPPRRPADQPRSLFDFQRMFPNEPACADYMERIRWPDGFVCPSCNAARDPYRFASRPEVLRCRACQHDTSLTAGTIMHKSRMPLHMWFWAAYLVSTQTPGMSATQFQRQMGISRYETAFQLLHKLRSGMIRPDHDSIGDPYPVEVDEAFVGGRTRGKGRGVTDAPLVVAAVEVRTRESPRKGRRMVYAGRLRLRHVVSRAREELEPFVRESVLVGSTVRTDGCNAYDYLRAFGYDHQPLVLAGDHELTDEHLPMIHVVFSNLKTWLRGTHHGVSPQHLQSYLNEYVFRFNRRFYPMTSFASVLGIGSLERGPTYAGLYGGEWEHKQNPPPEDRPRGRTGPRKPARRKGPINRRRRPSRAG